MAERGAGGGGLPLLDNWPRHGPSDLCPWLGSPFREQEKKNTMCNGERHRLVEATREFISETEKHREGEAGIETEQKQTSETGTRRQK